MNIHPLFLHFPIALLVVYSVLEFLPMSSVHFKLNWRRVKIFILVIGVLSAFATLITGAMAEELLTDPEKLKIVELHSGFAGTATVIFSILAVLYLVGWFDETYGGIKRPHFLSVIWRLLERVKYLVLDTKIKYIFVGAGFIAIFITGSLGGAMVHGPEADPFVSFVYHLFF